MERGLALPDSVFRIPTPTPVSRLLYCVFCLLAPRFEIRASPRSHQFPSRATLSAEASSVAKAMEDTLAKVDHGVFQATASHTRTHTCNRYTLTFV
jgi:hypothetical protein